MTTPSTSTRDGECTKRVLLIDDDASILEVLRIGLRMEGYEVATARNGLEALEVLEASGADLVIADLMMPVMDGRTFLRKVRGELGLELPVVVLTGVDREEVVEEMEGEGACFVLRKPLQIESIAGMVAGIWEEGGRGVD